MNFQIFLRFKHEVYKHHLEATKGSKPYSILHHFHCTLQAVKITSQDFYKVSKFSELSNVCVTHTFTDRYMKLLISTF